ncbi:MAG: recombination mediator RecR [Holosporaceae bacterium]|jgi:recombination protein RecR|nr:recombination mediator RecR [Holosporaceae bacterium]
MSPDIEALIRKISGLPGLGPRSARRIVIHLIKNREQVMEPILNGLENLYKNVKICPICSNVDSFSAICSICSDENRIKDTICIVESVADLWAVERTACFHGQYHVLKGLLSSMEGRGPEFLMLDQLQRRCEKNKVSEIIIALSATLEGQTTSHYIKDFFKNKNIKITMLAHGIPVGGELDYLDDGTLFAAFSARN